MGKYFLTVYCLQFDTSKNRVKLKNATDILEKPEIFLLI